jgi:predicted transcriptional regulator
MGGIIEGVIVARMADSCVEESHVFVGSNVEKINRDAEAKFRELVAAAAEGEVVTDEDMEACVENGYADFEGKGSDHRTTMVIITHPDTAHIC